MLDKHLPLDAAAHVIAKLTLTSGQISRANRSMQRIVRHAWTRQRALKGRIDYDEFADTVAVRDWALLFEACALLELGRSHEAVAFIVSARAHRTTDQNRTHDDSR
ncbi:hypothetical protein J2Z21_009360 [Streptomyces griseochromogenes]|uniref:Uncharacterized protein n=1 Tax=Streptomyces griseochromogenes TaxID=68214 RepID=A0A1B1B4C9_9ACTN|nr:hypothetical protein [Streptomyces griseochromogenes]ANP53674.1 hypothetical protein AVL59_32685 [Streptomyces griseochromogenes]MBP2056342.1 hypothetical protein [Streptomyces griseochromogenes]